MMKQTECERRKMMKKLLSVFLALMLLLALVPALAEGEVAAFVATIAKHGNLELDISGEALMAQGLEYGDVLKVTIADAAWEMPLGSNYSDVDNGMPVMRSKNDASPVVIALNMSDFATAAQIAVKSATEEEPGYRWDYLMEQPVQVFISLKEKAGYREQWLLHQLVRTNERSDYAHLSDEDFANFRMVDTTGIRQGVLYRSSSPINPEIGRSVYADAAAKDAEIKTVINLADASNTYDAIENAYYPSCSTVYLNLGVDFSSADFKAGLAKGLRFMLENEPPYLVHCNEGKDRAGFASALLECLMGASAEEVITDYMHTYINYYGLEKGTEKYDAVVGSNITQTLEAAFGVEDVYTADLAREAEAFVMEELGLVQQEVDALKEKLGK